MQHKLKKILEMSYSYASIERDIVYPNMDRGENDAEHSMQLALAAWYIVDTDRLDLDIARIFKLCIAHDLVEIYSGDVPLWGPTGHEEKDAKERQAIETIKQNLPEIAGIPEAIEEYKARETKEAKFTAGLDKLLPLLNQIATDGRVWKYRKVSLSRALSVLEKQALITPYLAAYFDEATKELKANSAKYFDM
ncbi:MAG: HD domain-containing protein [Patescibacteria group bacterium]